MPHYAGIWRVPLPSPACYPHQPKCFRHGIGFRCVYTVHRSHHLPPLAHSLHLRMTSSSLLFVPSSIPRDGEQLCPCICYRFANSLTYDFVPDLVRLRQRVKQSRPESSSRSSSNISESECGDDDNALLALSSAASFSLGASSVPVPPAKRTFRVETSFSSVSHCGSDNDDLSCRHTTKPKHGSSATASVLFSLPTKFAAKDWPEAKSILIGYMKNTGHSRAFIRTSKCPPAHRGYWAKLICPDCPSYSFGSANGVDSHTWTVNSQGHDVCTTSLSLKPAPSPQVTVSVVTTIMTSSCNICSGCDSCCRQRLLFDEWEMKEGCECRP